MKIRITKHFKNDWLSKWTKENATRYRLTNTNLKHIQNFNKAVKQNSNGQYYINYENRKKLVNGLKAMRKASNAIEYLIHIKPNQRVRMERALMHQIYSHENFYNMTRQRMIREFERRRHLKYAKKIKNYPSIVRGWNKIIQKPNGNKPSITVPGVLGRVVNTPWTRYVRNRLVSVKPSSPKKSPPRLPRNFGTWHNFGNYIIRPNMRAVYYPNLKTLWLNGKVYSGKNMGIPF